MNARAGNDPLLGLLQEGIENRVFPGAAFAVGDRRGTRYGYAGSQTYAPGSRAIDGGSLWDLASLTKVVATTPVAMSLVQEGALDLDSSVSSILPEFRSKFKEQVTVRNLLRHDSGLPAYADTWGLRNADEMWTRICSLELERGPGGSPVYSCVGFAVLQQVLERLAGRRLDELAVQRVFGPLGMGKAGFRPIPERRGGCVPTAALPDWQRALEDERGFARVQDDYVQGDVHDPIACVMGGVSGNAGLFATAEDLAQYCRHLLGLEAGPLDPAIVSQWAQRSGSDGDHCLGWMAKSREGSSAGAQFSERSFGHTGYTGTSLWIDPERRLFAVLLTNRVHPDDRKEGIAAFRPRFHDAAVRLLASPYQVTPRRSV